ncbi:glycosyltransferase family 31 protein [Hypoxylon crocopeplum]|nr:glycosyltransferase family 31 protein [Hypoxylon crocopeplum]
MAILRHYYCRRLILLAMCLIVLLITSTRLSEWSLHTSSVGIPPLRRPHNSANTNSTSGFVVSVQSNDLTHPPTRPYDSSCASIPDTSNILVVVKTGASESYSRIPTQLFTILRCLPDFLIFSDMEQNIAGYHVYDSLDTVVTEVKEGNREFDLYRRQQACAVDQQTCNANSGRATKTEAWNLDKYKNIHIAEKTYRLRPNYDWYLFIDADTYVLWHNLVQWLRKVKDPSTKKHYIGNVNLLGGFRFGHGGSGYILSQATMWDLAMNHSGIANRYGMKAKQSCCGDYVLAFALNETLGLGVSWGWPTINGKKPHNIPYGPNQWCQTEFEKRFYESSVVPRPVLRFRDIYHEFVEPKLTTRRDDWDNISEHMLYLHPDREKHHYSQWQKDHAKKLEKQIQVAAVEWDAHKSFEHCRQLCDATRNCMQFSYHDGVCAYHRTFRLGKPAKADKEKNRWISGWNVERIQAWVEKQEQCKEPVWPSLFIGT